MTNNLSSSPLSAEQQQRLGQLLAELGSDQIYWLAGYLAGYCFSNSPSATASQASAVGGRELTILFGSQTGNAEGRSEEHTSELQSRPHLVCRLLLEKKK